MSIANYDVYVSQMLSLFLIRGMFHDLIICVSRSIDNVITATVVGVEPGYTVLAM